LLRRFPFDANAARPPRPKAAETLDSIKVKRALRLPTGALANECQRLTGEVRGTFPARSFSRHRFDRLCFFLFPLIVVRLCSPVAFFFRRHSQSLGRLSFLHFPGERPVSRCLHSAPVDRRRFCHVPFIEPRVVIDSCEARCGAPGRFHSRRSNAAPENRWAARRTSSNNFFVTTEFRAERRAVAPFALYFAFYRAPRRYRLLRGSLRCPRPLSLSPIERPHRKTDGPARRTSSNNNFVTTEFRAERRAVAPVRTLLCLPSSPASFPTPARLPQLYVPFVCASRNDTCARLA
jgi:hypothetical protein